MKSVVNVSWQRTMKSVRTDYVKYIINKNGQDAPLKKKYGETNPFCIWKLGNLQDRQNNYFISILLFLI